MILGSFSSRQLAGIHPVCVGYRPLVEPVDILGGAVIRVYPPSPVSHRGVGKVYHSTCCTALVYWGERLRRFSCSQSAGVNHEEARSTDRLHPGRSARCGRHHFGSPGVSPTRHSICQGIGSTYGVPKQSAAIEFGDAGRPWDACSPTAVWLVRSSPSTSGRSSFGKAAYQEPVAHPGKNESAGTTPTNDLDLPVSPRSAKHNRYGSGGTLCVRGRDCGRPLWLSGTLACRSETAQWILEFQRLPRAARRRIQCRPSRRRRTVRGE
jgi:hypothetical protein